jgi:hypothetical protein
LLTLTEIEAAKMNRASSSATGIATMIRAVIAGARRPVCIVCARQKNGLKKAAQIFL